ncbi:carbonic anhydrase [Candidatus Micrarchaeota archaeon]|nr:carbonic anhydrase [Candidatus Micrarchaeota archaeon]
MDAQQAMGKLMEGNARFVKGERKEYDFLARRQELLAGQHPFATVITCSDSRVVPEFIFDVTMGEIFKIETAGNILDAVGLGSVEYGVEHLHTPILMVLGHSKCGAVTSCCGCKGEGEGNLGKIMEQIKPAGEKAEWDVDSAILENMDCVKECILANSPVVKEAVEEGKVKLVLAKYILETGEVKVLG